MLENGQKGAQEPGSGAGMFNAIQFIAKQLLNKCNVAAIVEVMSVTNTGGVSPVGFVDIHPLVNQIDGYGKAIPHGTIHNVPYFRLQGGANAVIIDPQVGDIGIAIFADTDSSVVTKTKKQGNPGSRRKFSKSDGIYMGGILNGVPTAYIEFSSAGIKVHSTNAVTVDAPAVNLQNGGASLQALLTAAFATWSAGHTHQVTAVGSPTGTPLTSPPANAQTTATKAE